MQQITKKINQEISIAENIHTFVLHERVKEDGRELALLREYIKTKKAAILFYLVRTGAVIKHTEQHNLITTAGRAVLCNLLAGNTTYSGQINYGLLGTGTPNVVNGATQLVTEAYRKTFSSHTSSGNIAYIDFFFAATDWNGTATEFGNVIDGTASANTGQLFSYIATGGWVKTALQSLFISCQYTIN